MKKLLISVFVSALSVLTLMSTGTVKANAKTFEFDENSSKIVQLSSNLTAIENKKQRVNLLNLMQCHINYAMEDDGQREIEKIKELKDFTGSIYTLFELSPVGYIIYHNDSGIVFEYASKSESPYLGYNDNLYYGGMMNYFYKENDIYYNTLIKYEIVREEESQYLIDNSSIIYSKNLELPDQANLDFVNGKTDISTVVSLWKSEEEIVPLASKDQPNISMEDFFKPLTTQYSMGYTTVGNSGVCGYIAANLVLAYNTIAYDDALVSETYLDKTNRTLKGSALTRELIRQHGKDPDADSIAGTTADSMGDCVRNYLKNVSSGTKPWKVTTWWGIINSQGAIKNNQPPILFGNMKYPSSSSSTNGNITFDDGAHGSGNHAVVAYGYTNSKYRVHYGWSGYSDVILNPNAIGGTMILSYF